MNYPLKKRAKHQKGPKNPMLAKVPGAQAISHLLRQWDGKHTEALAFADGMDQLGKIPARLTPDQTTTSVCGFCSTGCGLYLHLKAGEAINLSADPLHPVNLGKACPKGWEALAPLKSEDRATIPLMKEANGQRKAISWHEALKLFCDRFKSIQQTHGSESVAFLSTGQIPTEEMALLGALGKFGMGMLHGDGNTRQCMATAVVAYKQAFGFDAPPFTYQDFEESDVLVFVGANPCIAHPIMWERVCHNPHNPEIIVIDPRFTETAMAATQHVALNPKSDLLLFYGLAKELIANDWVDRAFLSEHTNGMEEFELYLQTLAWTEICEATGLSQLQFHQLAQTIHQGKRVSFWWTMGVNQSHQGVRTAQAIINVALMTGNIGRPGTGANSITGQCNAMGSRLFSNTTNLLGGHDFTNPAHRQKVASIMGIDASRIPDQNSWSYDRIIEGIERGQIKGLWVIATNPAHSWIHQSKFKKVLEQLDFLVVQDMYHSTETAQVADLLLPAAGWGEKEGTFINSERRIGRIRKVAKAPGQALSDFYVFKLIADYWGCSDLFQAWQSPEAVFQLMKQLSKDMPCDITGIEDYAMLEKHGGIQWPFKTGEQLSSNQRRLFEDGRFFHEDGKAKILFEASKEHPEPVSADFPILLLTGRGSSAQWHTQSRTAKSGVLSKLHSKEIYVEMHPSDAQAIHVQAQQQVRISSPRNFLVAKAVITNTVRPGQVFVPMHYDTTNLLTYPEFDPYSRQPAYKACAVRLEAIVP